MAKWGSQNLEDLQTVRQRLSELHRGSSDVAPVRSSIGLPDSTSDLDSLAEDQSNTSAVGIHSAFSTTTSPFASASDLAHQTEVRYLPTSIITSVRNILTTDSQLARLTRTLLVVQSFSIFRSWPKA